MRKFLLLFIQCLLIVGCASSPSDLQSTANQIPSATLAALTTTPSNTPTSTPTPLELPVAWGNPLPEVNTPINTTSATNLVELAHYSSGDYASVLSVSEGDKLIVRDYDGVSVYSKGETTPLLERDIPLEYYWGKFSLELQVTQDGKWALVDQTYLVETETGEFINLPEKYGLHYPDSSLAQNAARLAIGTISQFSIVDLESDETIYTWDGVSSGPHGLHPILSSDGDFLAATVGDQLSIWDIGTGEILFSIQYEGYQPRGWGFSSTGKLLAVAREGVLSIWDVKTGSQIQTIEDSCFEKNVRLPIDTWARPVFSDNDRYVSVAHPDCPRAVWRIEDGKKVSNKVPSVKGLDFTLSAQGDLQTIYNPKDYAPWNSDLFPVAYTDRLLLNVGRIFPENCFLIDLQQFRCSDLPSGYVSNSVKDRVFGMFDPSGVIHAYRLKGQKFEIFADETTEETIYSRDYFDTTPGNAVYPLAIDPIHNVLYTYSFMGNTFNVASSIVNYEKGKIIAEYDHWPNGGSGLRLLDIAFSDQNRLQSFCVTIYGDRAALGKFIIYDAEKGQNVYSKNMISCPGFSPAFSSDSTWVATANRLDTSTDGPKQILLVSLEDERPTTSYDYDCGITAIAIAPDDSLLTMGCEDGSVRFLAPDDFTEISRIQTGFQEVRGIYFSNDGTNLIVVSEAVIEVWGITGQE